MKNIISHLLIRFVVTGYFIALCFLSHSQNTLQCPPAYSCIPNITAAGGISGTGTTNYMAYFNTPNSLTSSNLFTTSLNRWQLGDIGQVSSLGIQTIADDIGLRVSVNGAPSNRGSLFVVNNASGSYIGNENNQSLFLSTTSTSRMEIDNAGKVGIGGSPTYKFQVTTATSNYGLVHTDGTTTFGTFVDATTGYMGTQSNSPFAIYTGGGSVQMIADYTTKNIGMGSGFLSPTAMLHVKGQGNTGGTFALKLDNSSATSLLSVANDGTLSLNSLLSWIPNTGLLISKPFFNQNPLVNVVGSTSGDADFSMPEQGNAYKKVIIHLNTLVGTASYTFNSPFTYTPVILTTSGLAAAVVTALSTTAVTVTGATTTGYIILEGY